MCMHACIWLLHVNSFHYSSLYVQVMISRGIKACPIGCSCDEVQRCGVKYHGP